MPRGYRYSRFCELYCGWASRLSVTMRQAHIGGDKLFVDYAGDTVPVIVDRLTGQVRAAQIFVAVPCRRRRAILNLRVSQHDDGTGLVLIGKRLEGTKFKLPAISDGVMRLSAAQLATLLDHP
jgi:transposase